VRNERDVMLLPH